MPAKLVAELSSLPEVDRVYLDAVNRQDLDVARSAIGAAVVQARGITGQGVQIAQIETLGRFSTTNPYLAGVLQDATYACATANDHTTGVAGVLRSTHPTLRGIAPDSNLRVGGSCTGISSELNNRAAAASDWGARIFSLSYSNDTNRQPGADDRFYDDLVFNSHRTVIKSAGNRAQRTATLTSPGLGYNVLTVGNFDDRDTPDWTDDSVNPTRAIRGRSRPTATGVSLSWQRLARTFTLYRYSAHGIPHFTLVPVSPRRWWPVLLRCCSNVTPTWVSGPKPYGRSCWRPRSTRSRVIPRSPAAAVWGACPRIGPTTWCSM